MNTSSPSIPSSPETAAGAVPDLRSYRQLHQALRTSLDRLVVTLTMKADADQFRADAMLRWFNGFSGELRAHHQVEDSVFFPALAARVPAYAQCSATLDDDHHQIDEAIAGLREALQRMANSAQASPANRNRAMASAVELRDLTSAHLDFEDADVLPMFERHFTVAEYAVLDQKALKSVTIRQALFTVPWWMATAEPDAAAETLRTAPLPLKIIYRLTRRRYSRLAFAALGEQSR
jgi:hemerythrin-like domain-containing protein